MGQGVAGSRAVRWLTGGLVFQDRGFTPLDLGVDAGRIVALEPPRQRPDDATIDCHGLFLLPGLIDCHVHLVMRGEDGDPAANATRSDDEIAAWAAGAAERTLLGGVTTARDVGGWNYLEIALRDEIERGERVGPRLFAAGRLLSVPTPAVEYYPGMYEVALGEEEVRAAVRTQLERGAEVIKVMATGAMLSPEGEDARAAQFTPAELRAAVEEAGAAGVPVAAHAHALEGIANAVEAGVASIEHGTFAGDAVLGRMAELGTFLVPTNSTASPLLRDEALTRATPDHLRRRLEESRETHIAAMRRATELGVRMAMGTDAGTPGNRHGENAQECVLMVEENGMSPGESIAAATSEAAALLGRAGDLGTLTVGAPADLIGCRADPLEDIRELTRLVLVMKGGAVYRDERGVSGATPPR